MSCRLGRVDLIVCSAERTTLLRTKKSCLVQLPGTGCSQRCRFESNHLRIFKIEAERLGWETALNRCKKEGGSLVTLYDDEDATFIKNYVMKNPYVTYWLGLTKKQTTVTTWSNGDPFTFSRSSVNPANIRNRDQRCEAMENNTWKGFNCSVKHSFMCHKGKLLETRGSQLVSPWDPHFAIVSES
uniref:C-type lectin domain-containing protein n=1 Tax=Stegastes partitus TaxID=144197 RepID=A0A3B4ZR50_9TELE